MSIGIFRLPTAKVHIFAQCVTRALNISSFYSAIAWFTLMTDHLYAMSVVQHLRPGQTCTIIATFTAKKNPTIAPIVMPNFRTKLR